MKDATLLLLHLLVLIGKILRPGGAKSVIAENMMMKQQLIVVRRSRRKAPNLIWTSLDLKRKLDDFKHYYNQHRVHSSITGTTPLEYSHEEAKNQLNINNYGWQSHCRGLYYTPVSV